MKSRLLNKKDLKLRKVASEADIGSLKNETDGNQPKCSMHKVKNTDQINLVGLTIE